MRTPFVELFWAFPRHPLLRNIHALVASVSEAPYPPFITLISPSISPPGMEGWVRLSAWREGTSTAPIMAQESGLTIPAGLPNTPPMHNLSISQLKEAIDIKERIEDLQSQLQHVLGRSSPSTFQTVVKQAKRTMSAAGRARIVAAQKARWAKIKGTAKSAMASVKKGGISAAGRARIAAAQKARWAKIKGKAVKSEKKAIKKVGKMSAAAKAKLSKMMKARWAEAKKKGVSLTKRKK